MDKAMVKVKVKAISDSKGMIVKEEDTEASLALLDPSTRDQTTATTTTTTTVVEVEVTQTVG